MKFHNFNDFKISNDEKHNIQPEYFPFFNTKREQDVIADSRDSSASQASSSAG